MKYTAGQAAKAAGVATSTITKALEKGKISGIKDDNGAWQIDPAELHRVYPPKAAQASESSSIERDERPEKEAENRGLERLVATLQEQIRDLREDRDGWRQQAERLSLKLPAPSNAPTSEPAQPVTVEAPAVGQGKRVGGFWSRLRGRAPSND